MLMVFDHDRKMIRSFLAGDRAPGKRQRAKPDTFEKFVEYVTARLKEDPHLRPNAITEHPTGEETQCDWVELPDTPLGWTFPTKRAYALVGSSTRSGV